MANKGPLTGLKVLDLSSLLPGPYATMMLADMGAEVLKLESPTRRDMIHTLPPMVMHGDEKTSYANLTLNRNKRSMTLDLKQPESIEVVKKLLLEYDILVEQFRPGVMKKLGLDYQTLSALNPKLIYCSITGYGQTGNMAHKAGHDINYLALSGIASYSGKQETGPVLSGFQIADVAGGSQHAVMSILAAVIARQQTDKGQWLDVSMTDAAFSLNAMFGASAVATKMSPKLSGTLLNGGCFYDYYKSQDDRYLSVGGLESKFANEFFKILGKPEWFNLYTQPDQASQQQLKSNVAAAIASKKLSEWVTIFANTDVCVEPVLTINEASESQLMNTRKMVLDVDLDGTLIKQIAPAVKFESQNLTVKVAAKTGQDTKSVLLELGYTEEQIKQLMAH